MQRAEGFENGQARGEIDINLVFGDLLAAEHAFHDQLMRGTADNAQIVFIMAQDLVVRGVIFRIQFQVTETGETVCRDTDLSCFFCNNNG